MNLKSQAYLVAVVGLVFLFLSDWKVAVGVALVAASLETDCRRRGRDTGGE